MNLLRGKRGQMVSTDTIKWILAIVAIVVLGIVIRNIVGSFAS